MTDPETLHPCARCARVQQTCCQRTEILVTEGDTARIAAYTGRDDFWERRPLVDRSYLAEDPGDPDWCRATVAPDATRAMLRKEPHGDCTFLGREGCVLPEETRPLVCRLYPFEYTHAGILGEAAEYCPTAVVDPGRRGMVRVLGMRREDAERWRRQLYHELGIPSAPEPCPSGRPTLMR